MMLRDGFWCLAVVKQSGVFVEREEAPSWIDLGGYLGR